MPEPKIETVKSLSVPGGRYIIVTSERGQYSCLAERDENEKACLERHGREMLDRARELVARSRVYLNAAEGL